MEKMVLQRLVWDLEDRHVYPPEMSGFREGRSSVDNVIALVKDIHRQKSVKNITVAVFLDIKAAFDSVAHEAVRREMSFVGIRGRMHTWLCDYLHNRYVYMTTNEGDTALHKITQGVPQGGVLSPTLFSICLIRIIKALPLGVSISIYADDICIWASGRNRRNIQSKLQKALVSIQKYLATCGLTISPEKCAAIAFTRRDVSRYPLVINGIQLPYVPTHKFLGITLGSPYPSSQRTPPFICAYFAHANWEDLGLFSAFIVKAL